jgi:hypothetical protein
MSAYAELLKLVEQQVADARDGKIEAAIDKLEARQRLLASAPAASSTDAPLIQEVLRLDKQLAGFIRERMLHIREQVLATGRGQVALRGYAAVPVGPQAGVRINSAR